MFYAHFVLAKKGPLARIWLAAHWDKKLTKAHVFETNIEKSVDGILQPKVKMALRTSGHLLLGVVRIYSRKAKYLLADCNEAFVKIKMAFRPGMVDLPEDNREAAINAITLPEVFHDFDTAMPELNDVDIEAQFSLNQSRAEEITMREDYAMTSLVEQEEGFGDMGFGPDAPDLLRHTSRLEQSLDQANLLFSEGVDHLDKVKDPQPSTSTAQLDRPALALDAPIRDDGFGGPLTNDIMGGGLFEEGLFDDTDMPGPPVDHSHSGQETGAIPSLAPVPAPGSDDDDDGDRFGGAPSPQSAGSDAGSRPVSPVDQVMGQVNDALPNHLPQPNIFPEPTAEEAAPEQLPPPRGSENQFSDQTVLLHNEEESFALGPVDTTALRGSTKHKRKRKLIVDEVKNISGEEMKSQLSDTSDIVTSLDLAPPTKRLMHWKETGGVEKLFALPGRNIPARVLFKNYQRHLTSRAAPNEDDGDREGMPFEQMDQEVTPAPGRRGRKRKNVDLEEHPALHDDGERIPATPAHLPVPSTPRASVIPSHHDHLDVPPLSVAAPSDLGNDSAVGLDPLSVPPLSVAPLDPEPDPESMAVDHHMPPSMTPHPHGPPNMTPMNMDASLPHLPPEQMRLLEQSLAPGQTPMHNMGYDATAHPHDPDMMANMGYDENGPPPTTPGAISEKGAPTPWQDDYDMPVSVGPPEEQANDETFEQFEERVLNKRAAHMYGLVKSKILFDNKLSFSELVVRNNRKQAAQKFYSLLMLKKFQVVELRQDESYSEISIERGPNFDNPTL